MGSMQLATGVTNAGVPLSRPFCGRAGAVLLPCKAEDNSLATSRPTARQKHGKSSCSTHRADTALVGKRVGVGMAAGLQAVHDHVHTLLHLLFVWVAVLVDIRLGHTVRAEEYLQQACTVRDWAQMGQV